MLVKSVITQIWISKKIRIYKKKNDEW